MRFERTVTPEVVHDLVRLAAGSVNMIAPGGIDTPGATKPLEGSGMTEKDMQDLRQGFIDTKIPLKRFGVPEDIGKVAVFLASSASDYMTGSAVVVDGGMLLS